MLLKRTYHYLRPLVHKLKSPGVKGCVSSFNDVRPDADVLLYILPSIQAVALRHTCKIVSVDAVICYDDVALCVCVCTFISSENRARS